MNTWTWEGWASSCMGGARMLSRGGSDCCGLRGDGGGRGAELVIGSGENATTELDTEGMEKKL